MRVPHTINPLIKEVYAPSSVTLRLKDEIDRTIRSEHFEVFFSMVETLATLCVHVIAKNFEKISFYEELDQVDKDHLVELLSTSLPLTLVIPVIDASIKY